jgi:hypothetical protein
MMSAYKKTEFTNPSVKGACVEWPWLQNFLVLLVNDSEYNNFTGQKPIQCHCGIYFVLPLARCCCCGSCGFLLLRLRAPPPYPAPLWGGKYQK